MPSAFDLLNQRIVACEKCPRLRAWCTKVAAEKRAAFRDQIYFGRPIPNFGDPRARLLILGLAPAAHGANRTGRMFTGDRSGDFLFRAMHETGFASQPTATNLHDGLTLHGAVITAAAHCAPPDNKPTPDELRNCAPFLDLTLAALPAFAAPRHCVILVLGKIAFDQAAALYRRRGWWPPAARRGITPAAPRPRFAHAAAFRLPAAPALLCSYHPSQQNTFTGRLTPAMFRQIFVHARQLLTD